MLVTDLQVVNILAGLNVAESQSGEDKSWCKYFYHFV